MKRDVTFQWIKDGKVKRFTDLQIVTKNDAEYQDYIKTVMRAIQTLDGVELVNSYYKDL